MIESLFEQYVDDVRAWGKEVSSLIDNQRKEDDRFQELRIKFEGLLSKLEFIDARNDLSLEFIERLHKEVAKLYEEASILTKSSILADDRQSTDRVPLGGHTLPPLPYSYEVLEPTISREIMSLHHKKHHQGYVDGLNKAEKMMAHARENGDFDLIKHWEREAAFHGSGHYLHTIFWNVMSPNGGGKPSGRLMKQITTDFGSYDNFKKHFSEAANSVEGVGWAILVWAPRAHRLEILQTEKHQVLTQWDTIPLLVLDVWEHAYYLQYKNERKSYVDNWWNIVHWKEVEHRFDASSNLRWQPY